MVEKIVCGKLMDFLNVINWGSLYFIDGLFWFIAFGKMLIRCIKLYGYFWVCLISLFKKGY